MAKPLPWTPEDEAFLRENHGKLSGTEMAEHLGRTPKACGVRATKLGIRSLRPGWTAARVGLELGVNTSTVIRWVAQELLEASRQPTYEANQTQHWCIEEKSIIRFLQTQYLKYDPARLQERWKAYVPWEERAKWISLEAASKEYYYSAQWFYELIWLGEIRATKGWNGVGEATYLYRQDIESVKARTWGTGPRPFTKRSNAKPLSGYKKQKRFRIKQNIFTLEKAGDWIRIRANRRRALTRAYHFLSNRYPVRIEVAGESILVKFFNTRELRRVLREIET